MFTLFFFSGFSLSSRKLRCFIILLRRYPACSLFLSISSLWSFPCFSYHYLQFVHFYLTQRFSLFVTCSNHLLQSFLQKLPSPLYHPSHLFYFFYFASCLFEFCPLTNSAFLSLPLPTSFSWPSLLTSSRSHDKCKSVSFYLSFNFSIAQYPQTILPS